MSDKVKYGEIIDALSQKTGFSKNKSEAFAKSLIAIVKEELKENGKASITNFGSFKVKEVAERQGQNPQTGEPITIPAHNRASFTPYKALRERVNTKYAHLEPVLIAESSPKKTDQEKERAPVSKIKEKTAGIHSSRQRPGKGNNVGLMIIAVLFIGVIAIASAWFFMNSDGNKITLQKQPAQENAEKKPVAVKSSESIEKPGTEDKSEMPPADSEKAATMQTYKVEPNEWYWVIAQKVYGNAHFWPLIFQENFDEHVAPDSLEENMELAIPQLQGTADNLTKQDYRALFEAAQMVSMAYHNAGNEAKAFEYARYSRQWEKAAKE